ncbi:AraC family transcriptional regulator [Allokutzneria sp. A3M-2-11 16]|uniref:AraC family transcriptional regulator n=1 Tax=Allokutzneria sp. A3M-2-11 16 TaxID=2962043 RepID=UPI0020B8A51D|nr:AraC family transcriptional regulator [Allokutzneria sp. A3M-2-11 16]MCP3802683.1 AraC family transcriptional regulator [Allokutzneria sp. A3M-2-11 16]
MLEGPLAGTSPRPPRAGHTLFRTRDLDAFREQITRSFCPHRVDLIGPGARLDARQHGMQLGRVALHHIDYGARVRVRAEAIDGFFAVQIPQAGSGVIRCGQREVVMSVDRGSVPGPTDDVDMVLDGGTPQLVVRLDREAVESRLHQLLGRPPRGVLRFDLGVDLTRPEVRAWLAQLRWARAELERGATPSPLVAEHLEQSLITGLLLAQRSNFSEALHADQAASMPRTVRRAVDIIEGHAAEPLTVEDLAEAVGVGVRALQGGFRRHLDTTPMAYLREVRLTKVHDELRAADPNSVITVTEVASRWGFWHPGRFAAAYRQRYGETPSATLQR